jgi:hypothetical protein
MKYTQVCTKKYELGEERMKKAARKKEQRKRKRKRKR